MVQNLKTSPIEPDYLSAAAGVDRISQVKASKIIARGVGHGTSDSRIQYSILIQSIS